MKLTAEQQERLNRAAAWPLGELHEEFALTDGNPRRTLRIIPQENDCPGYGRVRFSGVFLGRPVPGKPGHTTFRHLASFSLN